MTLMLDISKGSKVSDSNLSTPTSRVATGVRATYAAPTLSLLFVQSTAFPKLGGAGEGAYASTSR